MSETEKKAKIDKNNKALQNKLNADPALMSEADKKARAAIGKNIAVGATKNTVKKAGKDALKAMAVDALFKLLKEIMNGFVRWIKAAKKTFDGLLEEIKKALTSFFKKLKDKLFLTISAYYFAGLLSSADNEGWKRTRAMPYMRCLGQKLKQQCGATIRIAASLYEMRTK